MTTSSSTNNIWASSWMASSVYTILASPSKIAFNVHSGLLSKHSPVLRALLSDPRRWEENKIRTIVWKEWEAVTVSRFIEFLYSGDYSLPDIPDSPNVSSQQQVEPSTFCFGVASVARFTARTYVPLLDSDEPPSLHTRWSKLLAWNNIPPKSIELILHCHASLYALALYNQIEALADITLRNFVVALAEIPTLKHPSAIVSVVRYIYENTPPASRTSGPDKMRSTVAQYCAQNHTNFAGADVDELVQEGGDFVADYLQIIQKSLQWNKKQLDKQNSLVAKLQKAEIANSLEITKYQSEKANAEIDLTHEKVLARRLRLERDNANRSLAKSRRSRNQNMCSICSIVID